MKFRKIAALCLAATLAAATAGCSGGGGPAGSEQDAVTGAITFQTQGLKKDFAPFFEDLINRFEEANPGTEVKWVDDPGNDPKRVITDAVNGTLPDVVNVPGDTAYAMSQADTLLDFDTAASGVGDTFVPEIWDSIAFGPNGEHTALPWYWGPDVITYNAEILEKAGVPADAPMNTMDEIFDVADKVAAASKDGTSAMWGNPQNIFKVQWHNMGVEFMDKDLSRFTFGSDPQAENWVARMAALYKNGGIPKDSVAGSPDASQAFSEGALAFGSQNASFLRNVKNNAPEIYKSTSVAAGPRADGVTTAFNAQYVVIPKKTKNESTAIAFATFLTDAENQLAWCKDPSVVIFPSATKALDDEFFASEDSSDALGKARTIAAEAAKKAVAAPAEFDLSGAVAQAIVKELQLGIQGQLSPKEAIQNAQDKANQLLADMK